VTSSSGCIKPFREAAITAYNSRCAVSRLPEPLILDAAHIVADVEELLGQPVIPNGILLSKIDHAAFDAHLIAINRDYARMSPNGRSVRPMARCWKRSRGLTATRSTCHPVRRTAPAGIGLHCASRDSRRDERPPAKPGRLSLISKLLFPYQSSLTQWRRYQVAHEVAIGAQS
jgi:HNH endonuclease